MMLSNPPTQIKFTLTNSQVRAWMPLLLLLVSSQTLVHTGAYNTYVLNPPKGTTNNGWWAEQALAKFTEAQIPAIIVRPGGE